MENSVVKNIELEDCGKAIDVQRNGTSLVSRAVGVIKIVVLVPYFFFLMLALKVVDLSDRDRKSRKKLYF